MADALGDRMKALEVAAESWLSRGLPVLARLDGKAFHSYTRGMQRPFDEGLRECMVSAAETVMAECGAIAGYTQSDEISLLLWSENEDAEPYLGNRVQKLSSVLASVVTAKFNAQARSFWPDARRPFAFFDCRVWSVPTKEEAANAFLWRELDAMKNSISMVAHATFSHTVLHNKSGAQMVEMLRERGIEYEQYPACFRRGTHLSRAVVSSRFTAEEIDRLPPKHAARANPELSVERRVVRRMQYPPLVRVTNRVGVLFHGEVPQTKGADDDAKATG